MSDPSLALQAAIVAALKTAGGVSGLVGARVYDTVPDAPIFPYITLGPVQVLPDKADCIDGVEILPQIDGWSRANGSIESKKIGAAVIAALDDQALTVSGSSVVVFELQSVNYLRDPDGLTHHAAVTFRALLQRS